ncbi:MAG: SWF/SNF helicase family protein, partial [Flavobacteriales bacterium]|nr:SWF/SNF helicase family protein [Flavobacteriales bacterium]
DRMLFLTATPFQLGHHELVSVLRRFGDVRWNEQELGEQEAFIGKMKELHERLDDSQRSAIQFQRQWAKLPPDVVEGDPEAWWSSLASSDREQLERRYRDLLNAFDKARTARTQAQDQLRPWVLRHNKGHVWPEIQIKRRARSEGAAIHDGEGPGGLPVPADAMLPFFLAARSASNRGKDVLGEALSSSYQAFRNTRKNNRADKDDQESEPEELTKDGRTQWYLSRFDGALKKLSGSVHPKVNATVRRVVDLWEEGEKVIVFAFYRETCRALQLHISEELERRLKKTAKRHYRTERRMPTDEEVEAAITRVQEYYFDKGDSPGRQVLDGQLEQVIASRRSALAKLSDDQRSELKDVFRRFLRARTTLARSFPLALHGKLAPEEVVKSFIEHTDRSGDSWRQKFDRFIDILERSTQKELEAFLSAAKRLTTGDIYIRDEEGGRGRSLANVQVATGSTTREARSRLMLAFNTPFFPDILVCSEVMSEGVDLHRFCRHVIHHDLAWNPSAIEQRTGRIDRIGCKAENKHSIEVMLPYIAGAADERQFKVMSDREKWFKVVMGQEKVAELISEETEHLVPLPEAVADELGFDLTP